jgi:hypothetical protein
LGKGIFFVEAVERERGHTRAAIYQNALHG